MFRSFVLFFSFSFLFLSCEDSTGPEKLSFDEKLAGLTQLSINEISPENGVNRQFEITISQPLDHTDPEGVQFNQVFYLSHVDEHAPMVFMPSGYTASPRTLAEITEILNGNQIYIPHRFMAGAEPEVMEWEYLTVEQAAADFHRIAELFHAVYDGPWISYGASKNGSTALFHRRFYPNDVQATLTKVAPISFAVEDPRYDAFLENVGDTAIRDKIRRFQLQLLENREGLLPLIQNFMHNSGLAYSLSAGEILEYEALEYNFAFWQYGINDISTVPDTGLTAQQLFQILSESGYIPYYSDPYLKFYEPFYYQMYTELGYYRLVDDHLSHLLVDLPDPSYSAFAPPDITLDFNPTTMLDINNWLQTEGDNIIYIYGELDPWTAGAVQLTGQTNALKIIQAEANHSIFLHDLGLSETVYSTLEDWLNIDLERQIPLLSKSLLHQEVLTPVIN